MRSRPLAPRLHGPLPALLRLWGDIIAPRPPARAAPEHAGSGAEASYKSPGSGAIISLQSLALLLALAACDGPREQAAAYDYRRNHPLAVEPASEILRLDAADGLDEARLEAYAAAFLRQGGGVLEVSVGAAGDGDEAARAFARAIDGALLAGGLRPRELRPRLVIGDPALPPGTARLGFATLAVRLPDCPDWRAAAQNAPSANFGCAMQRNLGQMVADPRDLLTRRAEAPASGDRPGGIIDKYSANQPTWGPALPYSADTAGSGGGGGGR